MELIKYISKRLLDIILRFFWIFPIEGKTICFISEHSYSFGDNLKYLALYLKENTDYKIVFVAKDFLGIEEAGCIPVSFYSAKHFYYALTSCVVITNRGGISYLPIRKKQLVINTWHGGGPYKKTVGDAKDDFWYRKENKYNARKVDYILSSCRICSDTEIKGMEYEEKQCLNFGQPKVDPFFDNEADYRNYIHSYYGIEKNKRIILYAPTYRGEFEGYGCVISNEMLEIDPDRIINSLHQKFGGEWAFAVRLHPRLKNAKLKANNIVNMTNYPDVQEILFATDVLITDYSSIMWDYSYSKKPCFIYAKDIEEYSISPGFYSDYRTWPFSISKTTDELISCIDKFDMNKYWEKVEEHHIRTGSFETGKACELCAKLIAKHIESNY